MIGQDIKSTIDTATTELMFNLVLRNQGIGYCLEEFLSGIYLNENIVKLKIDFELPKVELVYLLSKDSENIAAEVFLKGLREYCK